MSQLQWSVFANEHAIVTSIILLLGSLISFIDKFKWWPVGIYTAIIAFIVLLLEYPRSSKKSGRVTERKFQRYLATIYTKLGSIYENFYPRFAFYAILSVPCFLTFSTLIPAFNLAFTSILYLISAIKNERWVMPELRKEEANLNKNFLNFPNRPPPRAEPNQL